MIIALNSDRGYYINLVVGTSWGTDEGDLDGTPRSMGEAGYCREKSPAGLKSRLSARRLDCRPDVAVFKRSVDALR